MKILITGGTGLVGTALEAILNDSKYSKYKPLFLSSKDCDLSNNTKCNLLFETFQPEYVIHLAANVGGLFKNMHNKVDMFEKNVMINMNVLQCCHKYKVKKCISSLSTCIFPDEISYPINEKMLHDGPPHYSNDAYAYAKRMLDIQSRAYQQNYSSQFYCVIPTNIYGENDNYHLEDAHVIPALIHQCYLAKINNTPFQVRGSGKPLRQFIYSRDLAVLIMKVLEYYEDNEPIILSVSEKDEISIENVARIIAKEMNMEDKMFFETGYSDGQYKKTASNKKLTQWLPEPFTFTPIEEGIHKSIVWFIENYHKCRK